MRDAIRVAASKVEPDRNANSVDLPVERGVPALDLTLFSPMDPRGLARAQSSLFEMPDDELDSFRFEGAEPEES